MGLIDRWLQTQFGAEAWEVWYEDTFDREDPPHVDIQGRGLRKGLAQLWARTMCESVTRTGQEGFSRFWLQWHRGRIIVTGALDGAKRIRDWLFGEGGSCMKGYVASADRPLLDKIVRAHLSLLREGEERAPQLILRLAAASADRTEFEKQLGMLAKK